MSRLHLGPFAATMSVKEWRQYFREEAIDIVDDMMAYAFTQGVATAEKNETLANVNGDEVTKRLKKLRKLLKKVVLRRIGLEHIPKEHRHE